MLDMIPLLDLEMRLLSTPRDSKRSMLRQEPSQHTVASNHLWSSVARSCPNVVPTSTTNSSSRVPCLNPVGPTPATARPHPMADHPTSDHAVRVHMGQKEYSPARCRLRRRCDLPYRSKWLPRT